LETLFILPYDSVKLCNELRRLRMDTLSFVEEDSFDAFLGSAEGVPVDIDRFPSGIALPLITPASIPRWSSDRLRPVSSRAMSASGRMHKRRDAESRHDFSGLAVRLSEYPTPV
jgi:hypothetical protein